MGCLFDFILGSFKYSLHLAFSLVKKHFIHLGNFLLGPWRALNYNFEFSGGRRR